MQDDKLMTPQEVAELLRVRTDWVQEMARDGQMPAMKLGRYWRFRRAAIDRWLNERETSPRGRRP